MYVEHVRQPSNYMLFVPLFLRFTVRYFELWLQNRSEFELKDLKNSIYSDFKLENGLNWLWIMEIQINSVRIKSTD